MSARARSGRGPILRGTAALLLAGALSGAHADDAPPDGPPPGWFGPPPGGSGGVLVGAVARPDFEGSRTSRIEPVIGAMVTWRTQRLGVFEAGSRGLVWTFLLQRDAALAVGLDLDPGRIDSGSRKLTPVGERPGSARLQGMGNVAATPVVSLAGSLTVAGVPLTAALRQATASYAGATLELGANLALHPTTHLTVSLAPSLTVADRATMQAYFGVTDAQAAASHRRAFDAHAGLKSAQLAVDMDLALSRHWHVDAKLLARRLLRDAADSPVTERPWQIGGMLAAVWQFQL
jgi:outer membrane scaffolding protein for murein synthesis (MipA/OmpV family)